VIARAAMNAVVRHTAPATSVFDGDVVFACSTGEPALDAAPGEVLRFGLWAEEALRRAIERAVAPRP
jgi:L-aminopeptidase/D-esterase-like protein